MKLGCHAVLFKKRIADETDYILKGLSETGFSGIEVGARFFGIERKNELIEKLDQYGLQLAGMHVGGTLKDWIDNEENIRKNVLSVAKFVDSLPNKNVIMSGGVLPEGYDLVEIARNIEKTARICRDMGVTLNYHNHAHEFERHAEIFKKLYEYAPSMCFALDLGWVYIGGSDPFDILRKYGDRVTYVHLRDVKQDTKEFVDLGKGDFNYLELMKVLDSILKKDGWAVVEYEEGEQDFNRYTKANAFLRSTLAKIGNNL